MLGFEKIHTKSYLWLKHHHCLFSLKHIDNNLHAPQAGAAQPLARLQVVVIPDTSISDNCWHKQKVLVLRN